MSEKTMGEKIAVIGDRVEDLRRWRDVHEERSRTESKALDEILSKHGTFIERHELWIDQHEKDVARMVGEQRGLIQENERRIIAVQEEQQMHITATEKLTASVDRLTARLPRTAGDNFKDTWNRAKPKTKVGLATVVALLVSPTMIAIVKAISDLVAQVAQLMH